MKVHSYARSLGGLSNIGRSTAIDYSRSSGGLTKLVIRHKQVSGGIARQLAGVGPRLSFGGRRAADGAPYPATPRAHPRGREAVTHAVRRRVRCLLRPDVTADSQALLRRAAAEGPVWVGYQPLDILVGNR